MLIVNLFLKIVVQGSDSLEEELQIQKSKVQLLFPFSHYISDSVSSHIQESIKWRRHLSIEKIANHSINALRKLKSLTYPLNDQWKFPNNAKNRWIRHLDQIKPKIFRHHLYGKSIWKQLAKYGFNSEGGNQIQ